MTDNEIPDELPPRDAVEGEAVAPEEVPDNPIRHYLRLKMGEELIVETDFGVITFKSDHP